MQVGASVSLMGKGAMSDLAILQHTCRWTCGQKKRPDACCAAWQRGVWHCVIPKHTFVHRLLQLRKHCMLFRDRT